uniref:ASCH domain-containing protein n=1 Tax=Cucumis sativus TaxID=3659 RepID=A0A0A0LFF1_CUCSA
MMKGRNSGNFSNPCLTMHQPWASLLVYGIKRIEGRSWPAPLRGRLWIHAASKVPEDSTIKAMEDFYRELYALDGITDLKFPEHYPVSRLLGCVEVVGCVRGEELKNWDKVPEGVRVEAQTDFCWLCEQPQKLLIPFEMRGFQGVYNLEKRIFEAAVRGLTRVKCPLPVKFQLPDPRDPFSLKPGSVSSCSPETKGSGSEVDKSSKLNAAIAGARAAATQFTRKYQDPQTSSDFGMGSKSRTEFLGGDQFQSSNFRQDNVSRGNFEVGMGSKSRTEFLGRDQFQSSHFRQDKVSRGNIQEQTSGYHVRSQGLFAQRQQQSRAPSKIFAAAVRDLKPT